MDNLRDLKDKINLQTLATHFWGKGRRSGKAIMYRARWRAGDRTPSFAVYVDGYKDFGTGESGTAIDFVMNELNVSLSEAIQWLQDYLGEQPTPVQPRPTPPKERTVSKTWQQEARVQQQWAQAYLWSSEGKLALRYLREQRGLTDETIRTAGLGYNPYWRKTGFVKANGKNAYLPPGIIIPYELDGDIYALRVRTPVGDLAHALRRRPQTGRNKKPLDKYLSMAGSQPAIAPYNNAAIKEDKPLLLVEGEFDALLAAQELEINVATLGSASANLNETWHKRLNSCSMVFCALDADTAGQKATRKLTEQLPATHVIPLRLPPGKDITDIVVKDGCDAKKWFAQQQQAWFPGGLPDSWREAIMNYLPTSCAPVLERLNEGLASGDLDPNHLTVKSILEANTANDWGLSESTIRRILKALDGIFLSTSETKLQLSRDTSVGESQRQQTVSDPEKKGRPAVVYRALPVATAEEAILRRAKHRLYEKFHPFEGDDPRLARPLAAMLEAVDADPRQAEALEQLFMSHWDERGYKRFKKAYNRLIVSLRNLYSTPLPENWPLTKDTEYKAAYLHVRVAADKESRRSRREIQQMLGIGNSTVTATLQRAGLRNQPQYAQQKIQSGKAVKPQIKRGAKKHRGYPRRLIAVRDDHTQMLALHDDADTDGFVEECTALGMDIKAEYQVASRQIIIRETYQQVRCGVSGGSDYQRKPRPRHYGPSFDPVWVMGQLALAVAWMTIYQVEDGHLVDTTTGEIVCRFVTGDGLVKVLLGQPLHSDPLLDEALRLGGVIAGHDPPESEPPPG